MKNTKPNREKAEGEKCPKCNHYELDKCASDGLWHCTGCGKTFVDNGLTSTGLFKVK